MFKPNSCNSEQYSQIEVKVNNISFQNVNPQSSQNSWFLSKLKNVIDHNNYKPLHAHHTRGGVGNMASPGGQVHKMITEK